MPTDKDKAINEDLKPILLEMAEKFFDFYSQVDKIRVRMYLDDNLDANAQGYRDQVSSLERELLNEYAKPELKGIPILELFVVNVTLADCIKLLSKHGFVEAPAYIVEAISRTDVAIRSKVEELVGKKFDAIALEIIQNAMDEKTARTKQFTKRTKSR